MPSPSRPARSTSCATRARPSTPGSARSPFVIVNAIAGLHTAAAVAVGVAVVLMIERLLRRRPVVNAIGGPARAPACAAFIALRTGRPEGYFVPRMLYQLALAVVFAGSVRGPPPARSASSSRALYRADPGWTDAPRACGATFSEVTLAWARAVRRCAAPSTPC